MKKIKPVFYDDFICSADKCPITCCMEWKIAVDNNTYDRWDSKECCGLRAKDQVTTVDEEGNGIIKLNEYKKCPFLNEDKLCSMVIKYGEEVLSKTCHTFPRQTHEFKGRSEETLVACCPQVIDLFRANVNGLYESELEINSEDELFNVRNLMIHLMDNKEYSPSRNLAMAFYIMLEVYDKDNIKDIEFAEYESVETIKELSHGINNVESSWRDTFEEKNELFLDIVENYRKEGLYKDFLEKITTKAEAFSNGLSQKDMTAKIELFDLKIGEYDDLFRTYLTNEIFTNLMLPDSDMESIVVMLQWIVMEFVVIRHAIFLKWIISDKQEIAYEDVRECIVIISRMTGYDEDDIFEYMENSFNSLIWEWGYAFLILGNN